jgi:dGTPase
MSSQWGVLGMHTIRLQLEAREQSLHSLAAHSVKCSRQRPEKPSPVRTEFQRDRDRIIHSKAFRRLKHKTQVFFSPEGDHYRTRLSHTLEMSQIARTIAKALNLNEDLTEAIALGHDLGHTPFGHIGEAVLNELSETGFTHFQQSLRVVDLLEADGRGLNLTDAVRDGIVRHSKGKGDFFPRGDKRGLPHTLEGQIVRLADIIAYVNHDLDDALRARIILPGDIPASSRRLLGDNFAKRIDTIVIDVIRSSLDNQLAFIAISPAVYQELTVLRDFLYKRLYFTLESPEEREKIENILQMLYARLLKNPGTYIARFPESDSQQLRTIDFIAGMTDRYALNLFHEFLFPNHKY